MAYVKSILNEARDHLRDLAAHLDAEMIAGRLPRAAGRGIKARVLVIQSLASAAEAAQRAGVTVVRTGHLPRDYAPTSAPTGDDLLTERAADDD